MKALTYMEHGKFELIKKQAAIHECPYGTLRPEDVQYRNDTLWLKYKRK